MKLTRDTEELKSNKDFSVGDFVSWNSSGGRARGKITKKVTNGKVPDIDADITGTKDDPAYQIRLYRDGEPTDTLVGHKGGALTKIDAIKSTDDLVEIVNKQNEVIESLRTIVESVLSLQVTEALEDSDEDDDIIKTHIGPPDESQLASIIKLTGVESTADQWTMVGVHASNNLLDRSGRRWGLRSLTLMGLDFIGRPLILNHSWEDAEASRGLIVSCALVKEDASVVPKDMLSGAGADEFNKEIIEKEGLHWLYMCVAIPNDSSAATAVKNRLMNDVSTGSILHSAYLRCPNCERESNGKEVRMDTYTIDKNGKKVFDCDHLAGSPFLRAVLGEEYDEYNFSDYVILDSQDVSSIELSLCQAGCLPKASIIRS